jgi:aminopeptidase N
LVWLEAWYGGTDLPAGLALDADLRWLVLQGLVACGAAGADDVEREASADRSVGGRREAALARALIPSVEAKRQAWRRAVEGVDEPTDVRLASIVGYAHPAHPRFTPSHVDLYLSTVDIIWRDQGSEVGRLFAAQAFPAAHASAGTLRAIDTWRAAAGHPPTLVRLVTDGRDQMVRALAGRTRDRAG